MGIPSTAKQPSLFSAIAIGVGCMIGSGWLFAAYYAAQYTGPASIISWVIGALLALMLALLLAEITAMYKERGLFSRLLSISHRNKDFGFIVAVSNWLGLLIVIPSEATATVEYLSTAIPRFSGYFMSKGQLTHWGVACVVVLIVVYGLINYWGIRGLAKVNNIITTVKFAVPIVTGILLILVSFHPENFTAYHGGFIPYGTGHIFSAVVQTGIFYSFYGFSTIAIFGSELKKPKKNIPLALVGSVAICLIIYLVLQVAFIGALPQDMVAKGWHQLHFTSPLSQLLLLVNLNVWSMILYIDSAISPSGTGIVYSGSATRMLTGMARDGQMPLYFDKLHPIFNLSRRSLVASILISIIVILFFRSWQSIVVMVTAVQLIACVAVPVAFTKLRLTHPDKERIFRFKGGSIVSPLIYLLVTYLMIQTGTHALIASFVVNWGFFLIYALSFYRGNIGSIVRAFLSTWTMLVYMLVTLGFAVFEEKHWLSTTVFWTALIIVTMVLFVLMINQKNYNADNQTSII